MNYWLAVESYENWLADKAAAFRLYGVAPSKMGLASKAREGDRIIMYVSSGKSALADVREVTADTIVRVNTNVDYDRPFQQALDTSPLVVLAERDWVPFRETASTLEFVAGVKDWRNLLRNSLRILSDSDGKLLCDKIFSQSR